MSENMRNLRKTALSAMMDDVTIRPPASMILPGCLAATAIASILAGTCFLFSKPGVEHLSTVDSVALWGLDFLVFAFLIVVRIRCQVSFQGNLLVYCGMFGNRHWVTLSPETYCDADFDRHGRFVILFVNLSSGKSVEIPMVFDNKDMIRLVATAREKFGIAVSPLLTRWLEEKSPVGRASADKYSDERRANFSCNGIALCKPHFGVSLIKKIVPVFFLMLLLTGSYLIPGWRYGGTRGGILLALLELTLTIPILFAIFGKRPSVFLHGSVLIFDDGRICHEIHVGKETNVSLTLRRNGESLWIFNRKPSCAIQIKGGLFSKTMLEKLAQTLNEKIGCRICNSAFQDAEADRGHDDIPFEPEMPKPNNTLYPR